MTIKEIKKEIAGVFKPPIKERYFGKLTYGTPYMWPSNFCSTIFSIRKLKKRTKKELEAYLLRYPFTVNTDKSKYENLPLVRRTWDTIISIFGVDFFIRLGWPVKIYRGELGWKDKFGTPRFEWSPAFMIYFFGLQYCVFWQSPDKKDIDTYWEMVLWYIHYADKDIKKAEKTWGWVNYNTKESTWNKNYLLNDTDKKN